MSDLHWKTGSQAIISCNTQANKTKTVLNLTKMREIEMENSAM